MESASSLAQVHDALNGVLLLPLIESAAGYAALPSLAAAPGVIRLVVGNIDFMADMGLQCDESESELAPLRFAIAIASRLNHLAPAVDGVTVQMGDEPRLRNDTHRALRFGFGGKLCIHPRQVAVIHQAFLPTEKELEWAQRVIAADAQAAGAAAQSWTDEWWTSRSFCSRDERLRGPLTLQRSDMSERDSPCVEGWRSS